MRPTSKFMRAGAWSIILCFIAEFAAPVAAHALTSGPAQPEFSSFEPVATTGMVNEFTGGFTYNLPVINIPGANGGGYAMSLSYHANHTAAEDASWVGYGWSLNPGAINRGKRGFADDLHSADVEYYNKAPKNETYAVSHEVSPQAFSLGGIPLSAGYSSMIRYNTFRGWSSVQGYSLGVANVVNFGYRIEDGFGKFSLNVSPLNLVSTLFMKTVDADKIRQDLKGTYDSKLSGQQKKAVYEKVLAEAHKRAGAYNSRVAGITGRLNAYMNSQITSHSQPLKAPKYTGAYYDFKFNLHTSAAPGLPGQSGPTTGPQGSYTWQQPIATQTKQAFGFMYSGAAHHVDSRDDAIVDYMTERGGDFIKRDRYLGIPFHNADNFAVTGEGLGGSFRMFNRRAGIMHPNREQSTLKAYNIGVELGFGTHFGFGGEHAIGFQRVGIDEWHGPNNGQLEFATTHDSLANWYDGEPYFFRFSGDKGGKLVFDGDDAPLETGVTIDNKPQPDTSMFHTQLNEGARAGRSSLICYNTNAEMLDTLGGVNYRAFTRDSMNLFGHVDRSSPELLKQIGEIAILDPNGNNYRYGLPVYSRNERSMRFVMNDGGNIDNVFSFAERHESSHNHVSGQVIASPYASSYLLTAITTPNYLDRTGDGVSADDFGGYTSFDYRRTAGTHEKSG